MGPSWRLPRNSHPLPRGSQGIPGDKSSKDFIQPANQCCPVLGLKLPTSCPHLLLQLGINVHQALTPGGRTVVRGHRIQATYSSPDTLPLNPGRKQDCVCGGVGWAVGVVARHLC